MRLTNFLLSCLLFILPLVTNSTTQADAGDKSRLLKSLFTEEWDHELRSDPETATLLGDNRYNDRMH
jgi:hypothetical protein